MNTQETRFDSYMKTDTRNRKKQILQVLSGKKLTARQICNNLKHTDMNFVRPRLTEMVKDGLLETCGSCYDELTERNVVIFKIKEVR